MTGWARSPVVPCFPHALHARAAVRLETVRLGKYGHPVPQSSLGAPDAVEIVPDHPIPVGEATIFISHDGVAVNVIDYTFAPGDANGNGLVELDDIAEFQRCFGKSPLTGVCLALDLIRDGTIDLDDYTELRILFTGP